MTSATSGLDVAAVTDTQDMYIEFGTRRLWYYQNWT